MSGPAGFLLLKSIIPETEKLVEMGVRVALTVAVAFVVQRGLFLVVGRVERLLARADAASREAAQRARTLGQILRSLCTVIVGGAALIHILAVLGWDVRPLLAGAGILGLAVGFGAQTAVRDVIAGLFILAENQFTVGDLIEINGKTATVEAISVRSSTLRDFNGYVHFVPNGEMRVVTNRSRGWNRLAVDAVIGADQDADRALEVCRGVVQGFNAEPRWRERVLDPVEVWGVESIGGQELQIRTVVRTRPGGDAPEASRELRRRLHRALAGAGIHTSATLR
jgi:small conductance mechanosensitive channel